MPVSRRDALALMAASAVLSACSRPARTTEVSHAPLTPSVTPSHTHAPTPTSPSAPPAPTFTSAPIPAHPVSSIPTGDVAHGHGQIALTIDDGVRSDVVEGYAQLCKRTGMRLTFFANGQYASWHDNQKLLAPLIESGQIVIGNHTLNHPDIRRRDIDFTHQIKGNEAIFHNLFGSQFSMQPYFRPPYGFYNASRLRDLRSMGYSCTTLWLGTTGDENSIPSSTIMRNLHTWSAPGRIIIGHANHPGVLKDFDAIHKLFEQRKLTTVTIADAYPRDTVVTSSS